METIRWAGWPRRMDIEQRIGARWLSPRRELVLRLRLWWLDNDARRALGPGDQDLLDRENLAVVLRLLNPGRPIEMALSVEILRELGRFDEAWSRMLSVGKCEGFDRLCSWQASMIRQSCPWLIRFPPLDDLVTPRFRDLTRIPSGRVKHPLLHQARNLAEWANRFIEMPRPEESDPWRLPLVNLTPPAKLEPPRSSPLGWFGKLWSRIRKRKNGKEDSFPSG